MLLFLPASTSAKYHIIFGRSILFLAFLLQDREWVSPARHDFEKTFVHFTRVPLTKPNELGMLSKTLRISYQA